jgi:hypothetical protein
MPIATQAQYDAMLDRAKQGKFAYPAITVTRLETPNAAAEAFTEVEPTREGIGLFGCTRPVQRREAGSVDGTEIGVVREVLAALGAELHGPSPRSGVQGPPGN